VTTGWRATAAVVTCVLHVAVFAPTVGDWSSIINNDFAPQAEAIQAGDLPYRDQDIEYPPLSVPVLVGPAYFGNGTDSFREDFAWEMLAFDLALVCLMALALPGDARRVLSALGIYTIGVVMLSGVVLAPSLIDTAPLILVRFDLVPVFFVLAAVLARDRARSATWSALLSIGAVVKAFPLLLYPALLRGETNLRRVVVAGAIPLVLCAAAVIIAGDEFGSAISYHTERALQVESLGATPFEIARTFGADVTSPVGHGGFEISASGATLVRWTSVLIGVAMYLLVLRAGWRSDVPNLELVTALVTVLVVFSPVLSPQFLLWILPLSAAAYGLGWNNLVLLVSILFTQISLQNYDGVEQLEDKFVWPVAARNLWLLVYLVMVCGPILQAGRSRPAERRQRGLAAASPAA
jgi:Glycosyltransferase family 87